MMRLFTLQSVAMMSSSTLTAILSWKLKDSHLTSAFSQKSSLRAIKAVGGMKPYSKQRWLPAQTEPTGIFEQSLHIAIIAKAASASLDLLPCWQSCWPNQMYFPMIIKYCTLFVRLSCMVRSVENKPHMYVEDNLARWLVDFFALTRIFPWICCCVHCVLFWAFRSGPYRCPSFCVSFWSMYDIVSRPMRCCGV